MISVRFTLTSGKTLRFQNVQSSIEALGQKCTQTDNLIVRGEDGKSVVIIGRHVESIEEL